MPIRKPLTNSLADCKMHDSNQRERTERPLVSVVVRTKERPVLLREALASIAAQTYSPIEAVIVNDGGADVAEIIDDFLSDIDHIQYIHLLCLI